MELTLDAKAKMGSTSLGKRASPLYRTLRVLYPEVAPVPRAATTWPNHSPWHALTEIGAELVEDNCHPHVVVCSVAVTVTEQHDLESQRENETE